MSRGSKVALLTGITGQDGAYLAELLLSKGYEVHGIKRRTSLFNTDRIDHLYQDPHDPDRRFVLHYGDMTDSLSLLRVMQQVQPDEVFNLAAQSHVAVSFEEPEYTADSDGLGTLRLLEAIRVLGLAGKTRFYQASTSELFGKVAEAPQTETTPFQTTARPTGSTPATASSSTTSRRSAARPSSPARSPGGWPVSSSACRIDSISATWVPGATGATRGTTSRRCG